MESIGVLRKIDELGRIVLPIEVRRTVNLSEKDSCEISVDGGNIILRPVKNTTQCEFCGKEEELMCWTNHLMCRSCIKELSEKAKPIENT